MESIQMMRKKIETGDIVLIINPKHKYYGERGTVKKVTPKMVNISIKNRRVSFLIMKKNVKIGSSPFPRKT